MFALMKVQCPASLHDLPSLCMQLNRLIMIQEFYDHYCTVSTSNHCKRRFHVIVDIDLDRILNLHHSKHAKASPLESMFLANGVFDMWREACLEIKPKLEDRHDHLPESAQFFWTMKCLLEEAVVNIDMLKKEHKKATAKYRYRAEGLTKLNAMVNPVIMKLTKEEDNAGINNLGPVYSSRATKNSFHPLNFIDFVINSYSFTSFEWAFNNWPLYFIFKWSNNWLLSLLVQ